MLAVGADSPRRRTLMPTQTEVVVFDVNETLSDMTPMARRFEEVGAPGHLAATWFASLLRDGFALAATGRQERFGRIGAGALRTVLIGAGVADDLDGKVERILAGFARLGLHPDVADGVRALRDGGLRLVTLTNGGSEVAEALLSRAGIRDLFERLLSVEEAARWKPAPEPYQYAARSCAVPPERMLLVAVHPWDIDGAVNAGLGAAWINRVGLPYPDYFHQPHLTAPSLTELAQQILSRS
jgi:2-haloacid dehalogenase